VFLGGLAFSSSCYVTSILIILSKVIHLFLPLSSVCRKPTKKLGAFCWLAVAIAIVETLICVKFGQGTICFQQMSLPNRFGKCGCILNKALSSTMHSHHCEVLFMCSNTLSIWFLHLNPNFVVDLILSCLFLQVSTPGQCLTGFFGPG
jgi:hypothetical protein